MSTGINAHLRSIGTGPSSLSLAPDLSPLGLASVEVEDAEENHGDRPMRNVSESDGATSTVSSRLGGLADTEGVSLETNDTST